jgi:hypothetical protein
MAARKIARDSVICGRVSTGLSVLAKAAALNRR